MLVQAMMFAVGQSLVFYIYAAGYFLSTHLIIEERTSYDRAFRSIYQHHAAITKYLLHCVLSSDTHCTRIFCTGCFLQFISQHCPSVKLALLLQT